jgi:hypothetical protein
LWPNRWSLDDLEEELFTNIPESSPLTANLAVQAVHNDLDTLTEGQMKRAPDREEFLKAQEPEIQGLLDMGVWEYCKISDVPSTHQIIDAVWSYRRKRRADGTLLKYKARLCVNGSRQTLGIDYLEKYAPVVAWSTIRLVLIVSVLCRLHCRQVDFRQAFPQADIDVPVYVRVPAGWEYVDEHGRVHTDRCLKLKKNLYGTKQAGRNWFLHLRQGLLKAGFRQSQIDPCLYLRNNCIMVVYVDDCLLFGPTDKDVLDTINELKQHFLLDDEGEVKNFLGIHVARDPKSRTITLTQPGLIEGVLEDLGLTRPGQQEKKRTPCVQILHPDADGAEQEETWNYRSVLGKLQFIAANTRPEIAFAVHQCARYCNNPKLLHEKALKHIGRYLLLTKDKGMILQPEANHQLNAYVDADFAGRWHKEYAHLRDSVLSRTGFILQYCGCPIVWSSKLQTEIALSTTEAEYLALSSCMREIIPMRTLIEEIARYGCINDLAVNGTKAFTRDLQTTKVFEDNQSCLINANSDHTKARTKHIAIKYHHFKDHIRRGTVEVIRVESAENHADIFTKPLKWVKFAYLRKLILGW